MPATVLITLFHLNIETFWNNLDLFTIILKSFGTFWFVPLRSWKVLVGAIWFVPHWSWKVLEQFGLFPFDLEKFWSDLVRSTLILKSIESIWSVPLRFWKVCKVFGLFYLWSSDILEYESSFYLHSQILWNKLFRSFSILKSLEYVDLNFLRSKKFWDKPFWSSSILKILE